MVTQVREGDLLWQPSESFKRQSRMRHFMDWLARERGLEFSDYGDLWQWSVDGLEEFWAAAWRYFDVQAVRPYREVLEARVMPGAHWFPGAWLNFVQHVFRDHEAVSGTGRASDQAGSHDAPAILFRSEMRPLTAVSWQELHRQVASMAAALRDMGVQRGDRVVAYVPNIPEAVVAFLASASIGAIWSSCSTDFGTGSVVDRFKQIEPKVLFAVDGSRYNGKDVDRLGVVRELEAALPTVEHTILIPYLNQEAGTDGLDRAVLWHTLLEHDRELSIEPVPFDHPLWVLYSSGTTGLPKPIVHGHGGILLEHLKKLSLHMNIGPGDRLFWYTTTGWMMWNMVVGGLLVGATIVLYDGSPAYPDYGVLWQLAEETGMTCFGTSAGYIGACMKAGIDPGTEFDLSRLVSMGSTGSPLPPEGFQWVYERIKPDLWLASVSGGTDVCTAFVGSCPLLPVYAGEIQCRCLGADVQAFDEAGRPVIDEVGELVITKPMPSMPLFFWNDPGNRRYLDSYFDMYPGFWRHGDWVKVTDLGTVIIYGRSDSTINRMGVRMGSSEIYSAVEDLPEVLDSLVIGLERPGGGYYMPLFIVLREGVMLDDELRDRIRHNIRLRASPRHVPDEIIAVPAVPRTLNGKKLEVPVKKILMGMPLEKAANPDGMSNPESMQYFVHFARERGLAPEKA